MSRYLFLIVMICGVAVVQSVTPKKLIERTDENGVNWIGPIRKCTKGDNRVMDACVEKITKDLTPLVGAGIEDLELRPLDPLSMDKFLYDRSYGPINITVQARSIVLVGFTKYKILKFQTDLNSLKMRFIYELPQLRLESMYKLGGNAFFLPLTGNGPAKFDIFNLRVEGEFIGKIGRNKDGEEVIQVAKTTFQRMTIGDMNLNIRGLFDGNAILSSVVHYVGKRFAPQVFEIIRPEIADFAGNMISHDLLNPILNKLPGLMQYIPRKN